MSPPQALLERIGEECALLSYRLEQEWQRHLSEEGAAEATRWLSAALDGIEAVGSQAVLDGAYRRCRDWLADVQEWM